MAAATGSGGLVSAAGRAARAGRLRKPRTECSAGDELGIRQPIRVPTHLFIRNLETPTRPTTGRRLCRRGGPAAAVGVREVIPVKLQRLDGFGIVGVLADNVGILHPANDILGVEGNHGLFQSVGHRRRPSAVAGLVAGG